MSFPDLSQYPYFSLDTETTGLQYPVDRVFGVSIAMPDGRTFYWDARHVPVLQWLEDTCRHYRGTIINHHIKFDWLMLRASGCNLPLEKLDCTMVRACLIDEHLQDYSLDTVCHVYLGMRKEIGLYEKLAEIFGGLPTQKVQMPRLKDAPIELAAWYAENDALMALRLWEWQEREIAQQDLRSIVDFERSVLPSICKANARGIRVDLDAAERAMIGLTPIINEKQAELNGIAGWELNSNSPPQIKKLLAPEKRDGGWFVGKELIGTAGSGGPSLKAEFLRELTHPAAQLVLDVRSLLKTRDTFLAKHTIEHAVGGRVYPTINQTKGEGGGTGTGRLSYTDPAMQQIPSRNKKVAAIVKPCFLPDEGDVWVDLDQASFEVRIFAHLANDRAIIQRYIDNPDLDFHKAVADLTGLARDAEYSGQPNSKQLNLSMIFNQGKGATAKKMGMPWEWDEFENDQGQKIRYMRAGHEAQTVIDKYHQMLPGVQKLAKGCKAKAEERGYIKTQYGRHLRFPGGYKSYKASGLLIQATSADINKEMWKLIDEFGIKLLLNTHDSYGLSMLEGSGAAIAKELQSAMAERLPWLRVPLILELNGEGPNWWEAIK